MNAPRGYRRHAHHRKQANGKALSARSIFSTISVIRSLFRWICRHNYLHYNPASEMDLPRVERRLPKCTLRACKKITLHFGRRSAQLARRKSAGICRYFKVLQHSQVGCSGVQNVKLFFYRP